MIPLTNFKPGDLPAIPRTRGDDPLLNATVRNLKAYSPHTRG